MTLRSAGLAVAVGSPVFALYILGVLLLLDLESTSGQYALAMPVALFLGFVPWGFLINQVVASGQLPDRKSTSGWLSGVIAVLDSGKGALAVTLGWAAIDTSEGTMAAGLAVLTGHTAASLVFRHGRAGPVSVGGLLVMAWLPGTIAVASVPLAILAVRRGLPGGVAGGLGNDRGHTGAGFGGTDRAHLRSVCRTRRCADAVPVPEGAPSGSSNRR